MKSLFRKSTLEVAQELVGMYLAHKTPEGLCIGKIVETEAYLQDDPACHAFKGPRPRNAAMFGPPGKAYIYFIYGMYHCFNVVTAPEGRGEAVLIRALEPVAGIELMKKRRERKSGKPIAIEKLCNGPGKLVIAFGIRPSQNGKDLWKGEVKLLPKGYFGKASKFEIVKAARIGIRKAAKLPYRFYIKGSSFVSRGH